MTAGAPSAKTQTFKLTVTAAAPDFTWTDTGNASVAVLAGQSASYTFSARPVGGGSFSSVLSFGWGYLPAVISCGFSPASIVGGAGTTAVTLTMATAGPNSGTQSGPRHTVWTGEGARRHTHSSEGSRLHVLPFFTIGWAVMLGIVWVGRKRRGKPRPYGWVAGICLGLGLMALISCGGVAGGGGGPPPPGTGPGSPWSGNLFSEEGGESRPGGAIHKQFVATVNNS